MEVVIQKYVRFLLFISLYFSSLENTFCQPATNSFTFSVVSQGAKGDGVTNDAQAFKAAWATACKTKGGVMLIPSGHTFLLQPVTFDGTNCQPNVVVQVDGNIVAPDASKYSNNSPYWILFTGFTKGIQIKGNGIIDGRGASWWGPDTNSRAPHALAISKSVNVTVTGIRIKNSQRMHIYITSSQQVQINNFAVESPGESPNTDGIHLSSVQHANIHNATLACGDDCISIQTGSSDVKIYDVHCGPGHGYSIGGLGPNGEEAHVSSITVRDSSVRDALNGVRIKTWKGGSGSVFGVTFSGITMSNVKTPIVIDQNYCNGDHDCPEPSKKAVALSNISYTGIHGTYSNIPVSLVCSQYVACKYLTFTDINITPANKAAAPVCKNAYGTLSGKIIPSLSGCLSPTKTSPLRTPLAEKNM